MPSKRAKLNVRPLRGDDEDSSEYVLIEGDQKTLEWLGNRLIEHAKGGRGCGVQLHPNGPGNKHFARTALTGIYVHRLPCAHPTVDSQGLAGGRRLHKRPVRGRT